MATADSLNATLLDFSKFFPQNPSFISYSGSLTTPPCTEGIAWTLLDTPQSISSSQVRLLSHFLTFQWMRVIQLAVWIQGMSFC